MEAPQPVSSKSHKKAIYVGVGVLVCLVTGLTFGLAYMLGKKDKGEMVNQSFPPSPTPLSTEERKDNNRFKILAEIKEETQTCEGPLKVIITEFMGKGKSTLINNLLGFHDITQDNSELLINKQVEIVARRIALCLMPMHLIKSFQACLLWTLLDMKQRGNKTHRFQDKLRWDGSLSPGTKWWRWTGWNGCFYHCCWNEQADSVHALFDYTQLFLEDSAYNRVIFVMTKCEQLNSTMQRKRWDEFKSYYVEEAPGLDLLFKKAKILYSLVNFGFINEKRVGSTEIWTYTAKNINQQVLKTCLKYKGQSYDVLKMMDLVSSYPGKVERWNYLVGLKNSVSGYRRFLSKMEEAEPLTIELAKKHKKLAGQSNLLTSYFNEKFTMQQRKSSSFSKKIEILENISEDMSSFISLMTDFEGMCRKTSALTEQLFKYQNEYGRLLKSYEKARYTFNSFVSGFKEGILYFDYKTAAENMFPEDHLEHLAMEKLYSLVQRIWELFANNEFERHSVIFHNVSILDRFSEFSFSSKSIKEQSIGELEIELESYKNPCENLKTMEIKYRDSISFIANSKPISLKQYLEKENVSVLEFPEYLKPMLSQNIFYFK
jgi:hypothetical protein